MEMINLWNQLNISCLAKKVNNETIHETLSQMVL